MKNEAAMHGLEAVAKLRARSDLLAHRLHRIGPISAGSDTEVALVRKAEAALKPFTTDRPLTRELDQAQKEVQRLKAQLNSSEDKAITLLAQVISSTPIGGTLDATPHAAGSDGGGTALPFALGTPHARAANPSLLATSIQEVERLAALPSPTQPKRLVGLPPTPFLQGSRTDPRYRPKWELEKNDAFPGLQGPLTHAYPGWRGQRDTWLKQQRHYLWAEAPEAPDARGACIHSWRNGSNASGGTSRPDNDPWQDNDPLSAYQDIELPDPNMDEGSATDPIQADGRFREIWSSVSYTPPEEASAVAQARAAVSTARFEMAPLLALLEPSFIKCLKAATCHHAMQPAERRTLESCLSQKKVAKAKAEAEAEAEAEAGMGSVMHPPTPTLAATQGRHASQLAGQQGQLRGMVPRGSGTPSALGMCGGLQQGMRGPPQGAPQPPMPPPQPPMPPSPLSMPAASMPPPARGLPPPAGGLPPPRAPSSLPPSMQAPSGGTRGLGPPRGPRGASTASGPARGLQQPRGLPPRLR